MFASCSLMDVSLRLSTASCTHSRARVSEVEASSRRLAALAKRSRGVWEFVEGVFGDVASGSDDSLNGAMSERLETKYVKCQTDEM